MLSRTLCAIDISIATKTEPLQNSIKIQDNSSVGYYLIAAALLIVAALWAWHYFRRMDTQRLLYQQLKKLKQQKADGKTRVLIYDLEKDVFYRFDERAHVHQVEKELYLSAEINDMARVVRANAADILAGKLPDQEKLMVGEGMNSQYAFHLSILKMDQENEASKNKLQVILHNVTEGYQMQQEHHESQVRFDAIFNHTSYSVMFFDKEGNMTDLNEVGVQHLGGESREAVLAQHLKLQEVFDVPAPSDDMQQIQLCVLDPRANFETTITPMFDEEHHIENVFLTCRDITHVVAADHKHKQNIHKLNVVRQQINRYLDQTDTVLRDTGLEMLVFNPDTHLVEIRTQFTGEAHQVTMLEVLSWIPVAERDGMLNMWAGMEERKDMSYELDITTTPKYFNGEGKTIHISYIPVKNHEGKITHYRGFAMDVTEKMKTEREIEIATHEAHENEKIKNTFLKHVTSDVNTPINIILDNVEKLGQDLSAEEQQKSIQEIQGNSMHLLDLVNDVLIYSRLEANRVEIKKEEVDLGAMFDSISRQAMPENTPVTLKVNNPYEHLVVDVDIPNLTQMLRMLTKLKTNYIHEGELDMMCRYHNGDLIIAMSDQGEGLTDELKETINAIIAGDSNPDDVSEHLAMIIAVRLVKMMGGKIELQSNIGTGTTSWISLPCVAKEILLKKNA